MLGPWVQDLCPDFKDDPRLFVAEVDVSAKTQSVNLVRNDVYATPGEGPVVLGGCYHQVDHKVFMVLDGFGVLRSRPIEGSAVTTVTFLRPNRVVSLSPLTAYEFTFDLTAELLWVSNRPASPGDRHAYPFKPQAPAVRADLNLCAISEWMDGRKQDVPKGAEFYFGDNKHIFLSQQANALTIRGRRALPFTHGTLGVVLAEVKLYLGL